MSLAGVMQVMNFSEFVVNSNISRVALERLPLAILSSILGVLQLNLNYMFKSIVNLPSNLLSEHGLSQLFSTKF